MLQFILKTPRFKHYIPGNTPNLKAHAEITRKAALEGMVLLKNMKNTLPIASQVNKLAVFGRTSYDFIAGGTGSGDVNHVYVVSLIEGLQNAGFHIDNNVKMAYDRYIPIATERVPKRAEGHPNAHFLSKRLIPEMDLSNMDMNSVAENNDMAIITIGKKSGEFEDRHLNGDFNLTDAERKMIMDVCSAFHEVNKKVIVILNVSGVIETDSWIKEADAVLVAWLPGQEGGNSVADILTGKETPSGRLPMTWPIDYGDVPSKDDFPFPDEISDEQLLEAVQDFTDTGERISGTRKNFDFTVYNEGIYVGYRYYTTNHVKVSYPFGYGLSYTKFEYETPIVTKDTHGNLKISIEVKNAGTIPGKEVVQVYVAAPGKDMDKPVHELKGFAKTKKLDAGEAETVMIDIPYENLASFNEEASCWQVEGGDYTIIIAKHASDEHPLKVVVGEKPGITEVVRPCLMLEQK